VRRFDQAAPNFQERGLGRVVPVCEIADEAEQCLLETLVAGRGFAGELAQEFAGLLFEVIRAVLVAGIGQQQAEQDRPARRQWAPGPPEVKRGGVALPDVFLVRRVF
jgi:hypothetical protein